MHVNVQPRSSLAATGPFGRSLSAAEVELRGGLLGTWRTRTLAATAPHAVEQVRDAGMLENFRAVETTAKVEYKGRYPFVDSDVYKLLEGLAHLLRTSEDRTLRDFYEESIELIASAQAESGYIGTRYSAPFSTEVPLSDLVESHELYNIGHLVQAAVAAHRQLGDDRLLTISRAAVDCVIDEIGGDPDRYDGHPEIEMALVELGRELGEKKYVDFAAELVSRRGRHAMKGHGFPFDYYVDHAPFTEIDSPVGHAVRYCYLASGATDVAVETGDAKELDRLTQVFVTMMETKSYITGGLGAHHSGEDFGDEYELPNERAYAETCAAIAAFQWGWRLFVATGSAGIADHLETLLLNAIAVGTGIEGTSFFYDNPLQVRPGNRRFGKEGEASFHQRVPWFGCACCPPNLVRLTAQFTDHVAMATENSLTIPMYTDGTIETAALSLDVVTDYPWNGTISFTVTAAASTGTTLRLRRPGWAEYTTVSINGEKLTAVAIDGWFEITRVFAPGDEVRLDIPMPAELYTSHPHLDSTGSCLAIKRGPVVYAVEDLDVSCSVDDLVVESVSVPDNVVDDNLHTLHAHGRISPAGTTEPLYRRISEPRPRGESPEYDFSVIPYFLWNNRRPGPMRVWIRSS